MAKQEGGKGKKEDSDAYQRGMTSFANDLLKEEPPSKHAARGEKVTGKKVG